MKYILSLIISGALVVSGFGQTRNVLVGTNNSVVQPINFWSADASNARSGLGLGSAATNPATAFQSSSAALSNIATGNGGALSNLQATNLVGIIPASNISTVTFTNISGTLSIASGGTGATNSANARQNLGSTAVGDAVFIATNAAAARTAINALATDGNAINLTNFPALLLRTNGSGAGLTNITAANISGAVAILSGGTGATNAETARTNLGLGWSALTNTDATNFRNAIGLGITNSPRFDGISFGSGDLSVSNETIKWSGIIRYEPETQSFYNSDQQLVASFINQELVDGTSNNISVFAWGSTNIEVNVPFIFGTSNSLFQTRTNLGLGWSALTNSNAGTGLVSVNTNGEVVSPTNFWQAAPIVTRFVEFQPTVSSSTNIAAARNLHIHSLTLSITGVTSTINLPTNGVFNGDIALVVHQGPTNSTTRVRTAGSTNDLVTMNRFDESVEFVYYDNVWQFNHNQSFIEPIYFSGTNAAANAAASRTNLGLGVTQTVQFGQVDAVTFLVDEGAITFTGTAAGTTRTNLGLGATNEVTFESVTANKLFFETNLVFDIETQEFALPVQFNNTTNAAITRTNLGLGATNNVSFSNVTASGTLTATGTITATTNLVVNGFVDFSTNHTNSNPATNNQIQKFLQIRIGTNAFFLPLYQ